MQVVEESLESRPPSKGGLAWGSSADTNPGESFPNNSSHNTPGRSADTSPGARSLALASGSAARSTPTVAQGPFSGTVPPPPSCVRVHAEH